MAEANSREARRRRRILQQGSDRLAFITGRIHNLPPPDPAPSSDHPNTTLVLPRGEAEVDSNSVLHNLDASSESIIQTAPLREGEIEDEISHVSTSEIEPEPEPEHVRVQPSTPPDSISQPQPPQAEEEPKHFINPSDISSAITASKRARFFCSIAMALLVVASYLGFSLQLIKTVINFRPLYLLLLTNSTLVVARLFSGKQRSRRRVSISSSEWDAQLARTLEMGLVVQSVVDAVFMDCAVYAIVLICGLSLLHT